MYQAAKKFTATCHMNYTIKANNPDGYSSDKKSRIERLRENPYKDNNTLGRWVAEYLFNVLPVKQKKRNKNRNKKGELIL